MIPMERLPGSAKKGPFASSPHNRVQSQRISGRRKAAREENHGEILLNNRISTAQPPARRDTAARDRDRDTAVHFLEIV